MPCRPKTFMRIPTSRPLVLCGLLLTTVAYSADPPCATRLDVVAACFRVRGTLKLSNGTPSARITVRGKKRVLGIVPYFVGNNESFAAPPELRSRASFDHPLTGEYLVCPLTKAKRREMQ